MEINGKLAIRIGFLFAVGVFFAVLLDACQPHRHLSSKPAVELRLRFSSWWIPVLWGTAAAIVGLLYPRGKIKDNQIDSEEWPRVMRCVAAFIGINQAITKINFSSNLQLSVALAILSVSLWYAFDGTHGGFKIGVSSAITSIFIMQIIMYHQLFKFTEHDFLYLRSWLPSVVFSGGITIGNIGRQLALIESSESTVKSHQE